MATRNGFNITLYIDARILADLIKALYAAGNKPRNFSEACRMALTEIRNQNIPEDKRCETQHEALETFHHYGFCTTAQLSPSATHKTFATQLSQESASETAESNSIIVQALKQFSDLTQRKEAHKLTPAEQSEYDTILKQLDATE